MALRRSLPMLRCQANRATEATWSLRRCRFGRNDAEDTTLWIIDSSGGRRILDDGKPMSINGPGAITTVRREQSSVPRNVHGTRNVRPIQTDLGVFTERKVSTPTCNSLLRSALRS